MSEPFDPYSRWLGIPAEDQPPNAYRLLGLDGYESDPDLISTAADQRMTHVKAQSTGPHARHAQQVLNELAQARLVLLDPMRRETYDTQLLRGEVVGLPASLLPPPGSGIALEDLGPPDEIAADSAALPLPKFQQAPSNQQLLGKLVTKRLVYAAAPLVALVLMLFALATVMSYFRNRENQPPGSGVTNEENHEAGAGVPQPNRDVSPWKVR